MAAPIPAIDFRTEVSEDAEQIEDLLNLAFGPGRYAKTAERLREGNVAIDELCHVAFDGAELIASVRFWPIRIGDSPALLLGPLAVVPARRGAGIGIRLMEIALQKARAMGHRFVILVGDQPYYARVGFRAASKGSIVLPGPVDPARVLWLDLSGTAEQSVSGEVSVLRDTSSLPGCRESGSGQTAH